MNERSGQNLLDFLASGINRDDPVIQALFSDREGAGAIANEIEELLSFIDYYTRTDDVRSHRAVPLEMITRQFVNMRRQLQEADSRLIRRMLSLTCRKGDTIWGNTQNMRHVFETYFEGIHAYISENTNDIADNRLADGEFEEGLWQLSGNAALTAESRFSGQRGLYFNGAAASAQQQIADIAAGLYTFHFFLRGSCGVQICANGQYWDGTAQPNRYVLQWKDTPTIIPFVSTEWNDVYCFIRADTDLINPLTITFMALPGEQASIDYARLFLKPANPSYTITIQFEGFSLSGKTLHLGAGAPDPVSGVNYRRASYYDHSFLIGRLGAYREEVYKTVLDTVRPRGIQAFVEFVEKNDAGNN
jgi:hypothetical protein